jgi:hypothetical protein
MSTCFLALPEDAGDKGRSPFQRLKSIDAVVSADVQSADVQQNVSGVQLIATTAAVSREQPLALSARLLFVLTSVLFLAHTALLIHAQSLQLPPDGPRRPLAPSPCTSRTISHPAKPSS